MEENQRNRRPANNKLDLMLDREEIEDDIKVDQTILMHYDRQVEKIGEEIGIAT